MNGMLILIIVGGVLAIAGVAMSLAFVRSRRAAGSPRRPSLGASAEVTSVKDTGNRFNHNPEVQMTLRVEPAAGPPFEASVRTVISQVNLPRFQPGARVEVRYDPAVPERVELAGNS